MCVMDSRKVEVVGLILGLQLKLVAYSEITFQMDILVIDVPDARGMLLSRKWGVTLGGNIQMDLSYATIPISENVLVKLHREREMKHHVEDPNEPMNEFIPQMGELENYAICSNFLVSTKENFKDQKIELACERNFDKVYPKSDKGIEIAIASSSRKSHNLAFRL